MPLYLVASPIGNLKDISYRAIDTLQHADYIYCEDTRVSSKLLSHYNIKSKLNSYHQHSSKQKLDEILLHLKNKENIAYLSDAGMPCISDPGKELVKLAIENQIEYTIIAGASAGVCAFAISQFMDSRFYFVGFLDRKKIQTELETFKNINVPIVVYESPHRIQNLLSEVLKILGDRKITIAREITKLYESFLHGKISELLEHDEIKNPKGEFVIVIEASKFEEINLSDDELINLAKKRLENGEKLSKISKELSKLGNLSRNEIYKILSK